MNTFMRKWKNACVEDDGAYMSKEAKSFCNSFKKMMQRESLKREYELVSVNVGHYYLSGFVKKDNLFVYFSYNIPRYGECVDFYTRDCHNGCLVRYAKNEKDFTGGQNSFCSLGSLPYTLGIMLGLEK